VTTKDSITADKYDMDDLTENNAKQKDFVMR
jgi:hypothetical protein